MMTFLGNKLILFCVCIALQLMSSTAQYEYLLLSQQWPPTVCMKGGCPGKTVPSKFTLHGMWPTNTSKPYPEFCSTDPKDAYQQMSNILEAQLHIEWPNLLKGTDEDFWKNEWDKHGTCSLSKFSQVDYFELSLKLKTSMNLLDLLNNANVGPSNQYSRPQTDIINAIKKGTQNFEPGIMCAPGTSTLQEIRVCYQPDGILFKDCPQPIKNVGCKTRVNIPL